MNVDVNDRSDEALERRLREACDAVIPNLVASPRTTWTGVDMDGAEVALDAGPRRARPRLVRVLAGAAAVAVAGLAVTAWATQLRGTDRTGTIETPGGTGPQTSGTPQVPEATTADSVPSFPEPCGDRACTTVPASAPEAPPTDLPHDAFDPLPVAPGASDYYAGGQDLGTPQVQLDWFDTLTRCARLTDDFSACERLEGIAGVNLVKYSTGLTVDTSASDRTESSFEISIGTTFTELTPGAYATEWRGPDEAPQQSAIVRGHPAVRYANDTNPTVVWRERPGVLVWVAVPPGSDDDLLRIAEGVRRVEGPSSIPNQVVIAPFSPGWAARNNNANGLLVGRAAGQECIGLDVIRSCEQEMGARTFVRTSPEGSRYVAGSTPANVETVIVETSNGDRTETDSVAFADYSSRFYLLDVGATEIRHVAWLDADGQQVDEVWFPEGQ